MPHINHGRGETRTFVVRKNSAQHMKERRRRSSPRGGLGKAWYEAKRARRNLGCSCCNPYGKNRRTNKRLRRTVFRTLEHKAYLESYEDTHG